MPTWRPAVAFITNWVARFGPEYVILDDACTGHVSACRGHESATQGCETASACCVSVFSCRRMLVQA
jgi:hypothetical protein